MLSFPWSFLSGLSTVGIFTMEYSEKRVQKVINQLRSHFWPFSQKKQVGWGLPHRPEETVMPGKGGMVFSLAPQACHIANYLY